MSGLTDRLRTAAAGDTSPHDGDGAQPARRSGSTRGILTAILVTNAIPAVSARLLLAHRSLSYPGTRTEVVPS